jgi:hypothetical protein
MSYEVYNVQINEKLLKIHNLITIILENFSIMY